MPLHGLVADRLAEELDATAPEPHAVVVANSAIIVFREGLEAVLILAAVMAPMLGGVLLPRRIREGAGAAPPRREAGRAH